MEAFESERASERHGGIVLGKRDGKLGLEFRLSVFSLVLRESEGNRV